MAASLIALLGAAGAAARALEHVSHLRHAPDQLVALTNEVSILSNPVQESSMKGYSPPYQGRRLACRFENGKRSR